MTNTTPGSTSPVVPPQPNSGTPPTPPVTEPVVNPVVPEVAKQMPETQNQTPATLSTPPANTTLPSVPPVSIPPAAIPPVSLPPVNDVAKDTKDTKDKEEVVAPKPLSATPLVPLSSIPGPGNSSPSLNETPKAASTDVVSPTGPTIPPTTPPPPPPASKAKDGGKAGPKFAAPLKYVIPVLLFLVLVVGGGIALMLSGQRQDNRNQASSATSTGSIESLTCSQIRGWACDSANFARPLQVAVYLDQFTQENLLLVVDANVNRADISAQCGGTTNHGFVIDIPSGRIPAGDHRLIVKGIPVGANGQLNTADMFDIPLLPGGRDTVSCGQIPAAACTMTFTAQEAPETAISCVKEVFQDEFSNRPGQYTYTTARTTFERGDVAVFRITMRNNGQESQTINLRDVLTEDNLDQLDFIDTSCGDYNADTRTITWTTNPISAGGQIDCGFRARVRTSITQPLTITNTAEITAENVTSTCVAPITVTIPGTSPSPTPSPSVSPTPSPSPVPTPSPSPSPTPVTCGGTCTTSAQCPNDHTCNNNRCELTACVNGSACTADRCQVNACGSNCTNSDQCPNDHTCNDGRCVLTTCLDDNNCAASLCRVTGCGVSCQDNLDCPGDHVCSSNRCILSACADGANCDANQCRVITTTPPTTTVVTVPGTLPSPAVGCNQPCNTNADCQASNHICTDTDNGRRCRLDSNTSSTTCAPADQVVIASPKPIAPQNLPVAGSTDIIKALGVGAAAVILGVVGLLLL